MERLSRFQKYKQYRNEINNTGEKKIATKELKELQDKLIFNEKRFGNNSKTESDLNRGIKGSTSDDFYNIFGSYDDEPINEPYLTKDDEVNSSTDSLEDVLREFNKIDSKSIEDTNTKQNSDYIENLKKMITNTDVDDSFEGTTSNDIDYQIKEVLNDVSHTSNESFIEEKEIRKEDLISNSSESISKMVDEMNQDVQDTSSEFDFNATSDKATETKGEIAEFDVPKFNAEIKEEPSKVETQPSSSLQNVVPKRSPIKVIVPQEDTSKEYIEICENVNRLAAAINENNTILKESTFPSKPIASNTPLDSLQNNAKKDMLKASTKPSFMENLESEVENFNRMNNSKTIDNIAGELIDNERHQNSASKEPVKNESLKKEFDSTVSIEAKKIRDEIDSFKPDDISADEILNVNNILKDNIEVDQQGKTIAFNLGNDENAEISKAPDVLDNTIIMANPPIDDTAIHTISFKKEDLNLENDEKSNTILNIILIVLIVIAILALGAIVYFFLLTRGIL